MSANNDNLGNQGAQFGLPTRIGVLMLRGYQLTLSPVLYTLGVRCRHEPSCSNYAIACMRRQGLWRGAWLALGRVLRCRPGGSWGYDPAPARRPDAPWWRIWGLRTGPVRRADGGGDTEGGEPEL